MDKRSIKIFRTFSVSISSGNIARGQDMTDSPQHLGYMDGFIATGTGIPFCLYKEYPLAGISSDQTVNHRIALSVTEQENLSNPWNLSAKGGYLNGFAAEQGRLHGFTGHLNAHFMALVQKKTNEIKSPPVPNADDSGGVTTSALFR